MTLVTMRVPDGRFRICAKKTAYLCGLIFLISGCAAENLVPTPEIVRVPGPVERIEVPGDLLVEHQPSEIPAQLTFGEALRLWNQDRATIELHLEDKQAIRDLNNEQISHDR